MNCVENGRISLKCALAIGSRFLRQTGGSEPMPFRKYSASFTPEQLEVLTAAFWAATAELTTAGIQISQPDLAKRILDRAADGIFDVTELKRAALEGLT